MVIVGWKPGALKALRGQYCVQYILDDGSSHYVTDRGKVQRLGADEVEDLVTIMNKAFDKGWKERDPYCVSPNHSVFGKYSTMMPSLKSGQRLLRCKQAKSTAFSPAIDTTYSSPQSYYAPLAALLDRKNGEPIVIRNTVFLVSQPLDLAALLENWREAGLQLPEYSVAILHSDADFDALMVKCLQLGLQLLIDPIFNLRGTLIKAYDVQALDSLINKRKRVIAERDILVTKLFHGKLKLS